MSDHFSNKLYVLQKIEHYGTQIYKIGRTNDLIRRLSGADYKNQVKNFLLTINSSNDVRDEKIVIRILKNLNYPVVQGREYFQGNLRVIKDIVYQVCVRNESKPNHNISGDIEDFEAELIKQASKELSTKLICVGEYWELEDQKKHDENHLLLHADISFKNLRNWWELPAQPLGEKTWTPFELFDPVESLKNIVGLKQGELNVHGYLGHPHVNKIIFENCEVEIIRLNGTNYTLDYLEKYLPVGIARQNNDYCFINSYREEIGNRCNFANIRVITGIPKNDAQYDEWYEKFLQKLERGNYVGNAAKIVLHHKFKPTIEISNFQVSY